MSKKARYYKLKYFDEYREEMKLRGMNFSVSSTSYSKKVKTDKFTVIFNETGDFDPKILGLINSVRKDGRDYLKKEPKLRDSTIFWYDLFEVPEEDEIICKVDLRSAYWIIAQRMGLVAPKSDNLLRSYYEGHPVKIMKNARVKSLGSLATNKKIEYYEHGKKIHDLTEFKTEPTRDIYLEVCRRVDELIRDCVSTVPGCVYYYWDCVFVKQKYSEDAVQFFKDMDYETSVGETTLQFHKFENGGNIISMRDNIAYMVKKESLHLLDKYK
ncbi:MAG TPA: hypothetical protein PLB70_04790 [Paludibacteraceae bacterium]|nr:hypothetical protein [Paludibacteraceae bacterium]